LAGAAVGSLSGTVLADSLGRIKAFVLDSLPLIIGSALCATSTSSTTMLVGRFVVGVGIGLSSALVPLYISEVAPTSARGKLGTINQLIICIGILGALVANVLLPVTAWRTMFWFAAIPAALLAAGETPQKMHRSDS
jgi:MFS family permease